MHMDRTEDPGVVEDKHGVWRCSIKSGWTTMVTTRTQLEDNPWRAFQRELA